MGLHLAKPEEYEDIRRFYHDMIDAMSGAEYKPGWEKDVYPSKELLYESIQNEELYYANSDAGVKACMIINHAYNDGYKSVNWSVNAADHELLVIHALGVHPAFAGQGIAKDMVQSAINLAKSRNMKTIRLDVLEGNEPAEHVYVNMGFRYVSTVQMYYEDTGWTNFRMFELIL